MNSTYPVQTVREGARPERMPEVGEPDDAIDLRKVFATLWRGKWLIVGAALAANAVGAYYAYRVAVPIYTAYSEVALDVREDRTLTDIESAVSGLSSDWRMVNTELELMRSRTLLRQLVERLDLMEDPRFNVSLARELYAPSPGPVDYLRGILPRLFGAPPPPVPVQPSEEDILEGVVNGVRSVISVHNDGDSFVFTLAATTPDPVLSAQLANALAEVYIEDQIAVKYEATDRAAAWLADRVADLRRELESAEEAVNDFNSATELVSPETLDVQNRQLKDLRDRRGVAQQDFAEAEARRAALEQARAAGDRTAMAAVADDPRLNRLALDVTSGGVEAALFDTRFDEVLERTVLEAGLARQQIEALDRSIADLTARVESQSSDLVTLQQLEREAEASRLIYESFLLRLREISIQQGIQQPDARIISNATVPGAPIAPSKKRIMATALLIGAIAGAGLVFLWEMMRPRGYRTAEELQRDTGLVVMGQIPLLPTRRRQDLVPYLIEKQTSAGSEAIRNLRTSLLLSDLDRPPQVILVTSCMPEEGKSTLSIFMAQSLAAMGRRVLLLEGDIRRRVFGQYFDLPTDLGFVSALSGDATLKQVIVREERLNLDILPGETTWVNAADLFTSERFQGFVESLREHYDHVIVDTPPVLVVPDARIMGRHADAILLSVRWDRTSSEQVRAGLDAFRTVGLPVTGLALNGIDPRKLKRYGYSRGYGNYGFGAKGYYRN